MGQLEPRKMNKTAWNVDRRTDVYKDTKGQRVSCGVVLLFLWSFDAAKRPRSWLQSKKTDFTSNQFALLDPGYSRPGCQEVIPGSPKDADVLKMVGKQRAEEGREQ